MFSDLWLLPTGCLCLTVFNCVLTFQHLNDIEKCISSCYSTSTFVCVNPVTVYKFQTNIYTLIVLCSVPLLLIDFLLYFFMTDEPAGSQLCSTVPA